VSLVLVDFVEVLNFNGIRVGISFDSLGFSIDFVKIYREISFMILFLGDLMTLFFGISSIFSGFDYKGYEEIYGPCNKQPECKTFGCFDESWENFIIFANGDIGLHEIVVESRWAD